MNNNKLHQAVFNNNSDLVKKLINDGIDVNSQDENGYTSLHKASCYNHLEIAELLINNNANINSQSKNNSTPLHIASFLDYLEIAKLLIKNNANITSQNKNGETPLHTASYLGHLEIAKLLIKNNANINIQNKSNETPLDIATRYKNTGIINLLKEKSLFKIIEFTREDINKFKSEDDVKKHIIKELKKDNSHQSIATETTVNTHLHITWDAGQKLLELDKKLVGTKDYMGIAYFWAYEYRHYLRDATPVSRARIHKKLLEAGLNAGETSGQHREIILEECNKHTDIINLLKEQK